MHVGRTDDDAASNAVRRPRSDEVHFECELAVVIGPRCKNVSRAHALDYVLGYTCANDVSARDWQIDLPPETGGIKWESYGWLG